MVGTRGSASASFIGVPELLSASTDIASFSSERGTTYLMGRVTQREADRATNVVRGTPGVQKVVRIFEVISEDELARLLPSPSKPQPAGTKPATN